MAHQITSTDSLFLVNKPAWHGLGTVLDHVPTREEAQRIAHPWNPAPEPIYRRELVSVDSEGEPIYAYHEVSDHQAVVRDDDKGLLGIAPKTREIVANDVMYDIAEAIEGTEAGSVRYETGGSLSGGRKVWLLLALTEPVQVPGDPSMAIPYFAIQNAHDGSGSFRGQALLTRIVCANTSHMADLEAQQRGTEFVFRHTASIHERIEQAKDALAMWRMGITEMLETATHLQSLEVTDAQVLDFVEQFVPLPEGEVVSDRVRENVRVARARVNGILESPTCKGINRSAWGLVSAATEYLDHVRRANTQESRLNRTLLSPERLKAGAMDIALAVAAR